MRYLITALLVLAGFAAGKFFEKIILARLRQAAGNTTWEGDDIIFDALRGVATLWFGLAGTHIALIHLPINSQSGSVGACPRTYAHKGLHYRELICYVWTVMV